MLELYVVPQLEEFQPWIIFQKDDAPPHWGSDVRRFLDATFPNRWIRRDGPTPWPPRSPDICSLDFVLWGYVNTFAASYLNTQRLNNSCLKSPASTLVDLTFQ